MTALRACTVHESTYHGAIVSPFRNWGGRGMSQRRKTQQDGMVEIADLDLLRRVDFNGDETVLDPMLSAESAQLQAIRSYVFFNRQYFMSMVIFGVANYHNVADFHVVERDSRVSILIRWFNQRCLQRLSAIWALIKVFPQRFRVGNHLAFLTNAARRLARHRLKHKFWHIVSDWIMVAHYTTARNQFAFGLTHSSSKASR